MKVMVKYLERDLEFSADKHRGSGLDGLIKFIGRNKGSIQEINITGSSNSYTFSRQVSLFANMVSAISGIKVMMNSQEVTPSNPSIPTYQ